MAPQYYPGWKTVFYIEEESIPIELIPDLQRLGAHIRLYSKMEFPNGMFPRFLIADDPNVERFLIRDVDSRPSQREVNAVNAWIQSGQGVHIMRDHPWHCSLIMGGLWGATRGVLQEVESKIKAFRRSRHPYTREATYGADQEFLVQHLWPKARGNSLIHDSFCRHGMPGIPFPDGRSEGDFVGSIYDENDQPIPEHIRARNSWIAANPSLQ